MISLYPTPWQLRVPPSVGLVLTVRLYVFYSSRDPRLLEFTLFLLLDALG